MNKLARQRAKVKVVKDVSDLRELTKSDLLSDSHVYDKDNYNPMENLNEKEVMVSKNKSDVITIRLTPQENKLISELADENGLSKSAFVRMVVKKALNNHEYHQ